MFQGKYPQLTLTFHKVTINNHSPKNRWIFLRNFSKELKTTANHEKHPSAHRF